MVERYGVGCGIVVSDVCGGEVFGVGWGGEVWCGVWDGGEWCVWWRGVWSGVGCGMVETLGLGVYICILNLIM